MDARRVFVAIASQTGEIVLHYWPISLALLIGAIAALTIGSPLGSSAFRRRAGTMALAYLIPLAIVLVGTVLRANQTPTNYGVPRFWQGIALWAPLALYLLTLVAALVLSKRERLRSVAFLAPGLWLSLCATLLAGFAIAGMAP